MRRFFVENDRITDNVAHILGEEVKHITKVLRLGKGDEVILFDEAGWEYRARIINGNLKELKAEILDKVFPQRESSLEIILGQSLPRRSKMDLIVQKATELGISQILTFNSRRSIPKLSEEKILKRVERWRKIALEATKQCGRNSIPHIGSPVDFSEILAKDLENGLKLMLWEGEAVSLSKVFDSNPDQNRFFVLVGPEGGFTYREVQEAEKTGFNIVSTGKRILRSETASISILSVIQHRFGDLN